MKNYEKQMLEDYKSDAEAFKGCLFALFAIGAVLGTVGTLIYLNL